MKIKTSEDKKTLMLAWHRQPFIIHGGGCILSACLSGLRLVIASRERFKRGKRAVAYAVESVVKPLRIVRNRLRDDGLRRRSWRIRVLNERGDVAYGK